MYDQILYSGSKMVVKLFPTTSNFVKSLQIVCTMYEKYSFLPNNCLTRIYSFYRHFETNSLYNSMNRYTFFAEQLFDKGSSYFTPSVQPLYASPGVLFDNIVAHNLYK
jgi:hypothetical protein